MSTPPRPHSFGPKAAVRPGSRTDRGSGVVPRLRPLATPRPIRVRTDSHDRPLALWSGQGWVAIEGVREEWCIDDEWWRTPVSREYRVVVLATGRVETIYRDRTTSIWYRQG